jgi:hypothetical protein
MVLVVAEGVEGASSGDPLVHHEGTTMIYRVLPWIVVRRPVDLHRGKR